MIDTRIVHTVTKTYPVVTVIFVSLFVLLGLASPTMQ